MEIDQLSASFKKLKTHLQVPIANASDALYIGCINKEINLLSC